MSISDKNLKKTHNTSINSPKFAAKFQKFPCTRKFGRRSPIPLKNADFQSVFARSASAVTLSKEVQLTLIGNPTRAFQ